MEFSSRCLQAGGPLAGSVGQIIGVGPGRGGGLLFISAGLLLVLVVVIGYLYPALRQMEDELPKAPAVQPGAGALGGQSLAPLPATD